MATENPDEIWRATRLIMFKRSDRFTPALQAMQRSVGLVIEDDTLIVGLQEADHHLAGHLQPAATRNDVQQALAVAAGRPLDFRVILGTTVGDWERSKTMDRQTVAAGLAAAERRKLGETMEHAWEQLMEKMMLGHQRLQLRQLPQVKAHFLMEALGWLTEVEEQIQHAPSHLAEHNQRAFGKAIERLATLVDLPPTQVAVELRHYQTSRGHRSARGDRSDDD